MTINNFQRVGSDHNAGVGLLRLVLGLRQIRAREFFFLLRRFWITKRFRGVGRDFLYGGLGGPRD